MYWRDTAASLDKKIRALEVQLFALKTQRNQITPFCGIPDEILEHTLLLLQTFPGREILAPGTEKTKKILRVELEWTRDMLICRRVRDVALQSGALWSTVDMDFAEMRHSQCWIDLCLQRANSHPLNMKGYVRHYQDSATQCLLAAFSQCRHLQLDLSPLNVFEEIEDRISKMDAFSIARHQAMSYLHQDVLQKSHEHLRSLEIASKLDSAHHWSTFLLNEKFLGGTRITLTHLRLFKIHISILPEMPLLQELCMGDFSNDMDCRALRKTLQSTPNLLALTLKNPIDKAHSKNLFPENIPDISSEPLCNLPCLRDLQLVGGVVQIPQLLQLFSPPDTETNFQVEIKEDHNIQYTNDELFLDHITAVTPKVQERVARYLSLICKGQYELICWISLAEDPEPMHKYVKMRFFGSPLEEVYTRILDLCLLYDYNDSMSDVLQWATTIHLCNYDRLRAFVSPIDMGNTPHLRHLIVYSLEIESNPRAGGLEGSEEAAFRRLLGNWHLLQGSPIHLVELRYFGESHNRYMRGTTQEKRESIQIEWQDAHWVHHLEWVDDW